MAPTSSVQILQLEAGFVRFYVSCFVEHFLPYTAKKLRSDFSMDAAFDVRENYLIKGSTRAQNAFWVLDRFSEEF